MCVALYGTLHHTSCVNKPPRLQHLRHAPASAQELRALAVVLVGIANHQGVLVQSPSFKCPGALDTCGIKFEVGPMFT